MSAVGWCPECGPVESYDEDGCCSCGCTCTGPGADKALKLDRARLTRVLRKLTARHRETEEDLLCARVAVRDYMARAESAERDRDAARAELAEMRERRCET